MHLHVISPELTFAGLHALEPPVIHVPVADASAVLKPRAARSATTGSAGLFERTAFGASPCFSHR